MKTNQPKVSKSTADTNYNDGMANMPAARGQTIIQAYGKDGSSLKGTEAGERGNEMKNTGLSRSMNAYK